MMDDLIEVFVEFDVVKTYRVGTTVQFLSSSSLENAIIEVEDDINFGDAVNESHLVSTEVRVATLDPR